METGLVRQGRIGPTNSQSDECSADVIIIGAGVAGLSAARHLKNSGLSVIVLEATSQHGGRVRSHTLGSTRIEMGAEEHYLELNNPVYPAVVAEFGENVYGPIGSGISSATIGNGQFCYELEERGISDTDIQNYLRYWEIYGGLDQHADVGLTMGDDIANRYGVKEGDPSYYLYENGLAGAVYSTSISKVGAASVAQQEALWALSDDVVGLTPVDLGYLDVLDQIWWKDVLDTVLLNRPVKHIQYGETGVCITDESGAVFNGQFVIVTASIGVLQSNVIQFAPPLPLTTVEAYCGIGMGKGMKVAIRFEEPFWPDELSYMVLNGVSGSFWVPTNYKVGATDHILMVYPMGDKAEALSVRANAQGAGQRAEEFIIEAILSDLDRLYDGAASRFYIEGAVRDFTAELYILGAHSFPIPQTYADGNWSMRKQLRQSVAGRLYFAGEATSDIASATVPGAFMEGERVAKEILSLYAAGTITGSVLT